MKCLAYYEFSRIASIQSLWARHTLPKECIHNAILAEPSTSKTSPKDTLEYSVLIPPFPIKEMDSYPRLLDIDVITIIQPLYQRDWFTERGPHSPLNNTDPLPYKSMSLCKAFLFNKYKDAIEFMGYVNEVIKS